MVDHEFAKLIEGALALQQARFVDALRAADPACPACALTVAGGPDGPLVQAAFGGVGHPISRVWGFGLQGSASPEQLDVIEAFFRERSEVCRIDLCPLADASALALLKDRGYTLATLTNVYFRPPPRPGEPLEPVPGVQLQRVDKADGRAIDEFDTTISRGFYGETPPPLHLRGLGSIAAKGPHSTCFLGRIGGEAAGGGGMELAGPVACLYGASTIEQYRRRGVQTALIRARLGVAQQAPGCRWVVIQTRPGIPSERNIVRAGFALAYTRPQLVREWPAVR